MKNNVKTCRECVFVGQSPQGDFGCMLLNKAIDLNETYCSWRIDNKDDLLCDNCHQHTYGKVIYSDKKVYCPRCAQMI